MQAFVRVPLSTFFTSKGSPSPNLLVFDTTHTPHLPLPFKLGDADLDGFPDLLTIIDRTPRLLFSVPCGRGVLGCDSDGNGRRGWKVAHKGTETLVGVKDARGVSFLDADEDVSFYELDSCTLIYLIFQGTLDILVQRTGDDGQGTVLFVQNNFYYDAFFLKAIGKLLCCPNANFTHKNSVLNGACNNGWCTGPNGTEHYHVRRSILLVILTDLVS